MIAPNPEDPGQVDVVANALANARGGRRGMPPMRNAIEMLESMGLRDLASDLKDDARMILTALRGL